MPQSFEDYQDLAGTGYQGGGGSGEPVAPEDEFFHSIYFPGSRRTNHLNIKEDPDLIQIRGVEYNLEEAYMVITHTKDILAKIKTENRKDTIECFSFKEGAAPWYGSSALPNGDKRPCPLTSAERAANNFCSSCKAQILVAGIYCNKDGSPILTEDRKPIFVFIRGKGMRYSNVSEYLNDRFNEDLTPIFEPVTEQSKQFEKSVVNNKRFVTKITKGEARTQYNSDVNVFELSKGAELPKDAVLKILKLSKDTVEKFNEKFDWSKRKGGSASGYGTSTPKPEGILEIGDPVDTEPSAQDASPVQSNDGEGKKTFSFDDIDF